MPLSKVKQAEYMREHRKRLRYNVIPNVTPVYIPWYNPNDHVVGRTVRMKDGQGRITVVVTPDVDADGRPIWEV